MQGVNGQCEQSARNYHGAIARNFYATSLRERLSCKAATPYNRLALKNCTTGLNMVK